MSQRPGCQPAARSAASTGAVKRVRSAVMWGGLVVFGRRPAVVRGVLSYVSR